MNEDQKQVAIFMLFIAVLVVAVLSVLLLNQVQQILVLGAVIAVLAVVYWFSPTFVVQLKEFERGVVFRMGKYERMIGPGWHFLIPFIETCTTVDLRIRTVDIKPQKVVTKDNIELTVDAILYLKVEDPVKAIVNVKDYEHSAVSYIQAHLRDVIGRMTMAEVLSNINEINKRLSEGIKEVDDEWGVAVQQVEIQSVDLPDIVVKAMHEKKAAEEQKLATKERAEASKMEIDAVREAAGKLSDPALQYLYLQSLQKIADGRSNKIIFPLELSRLAEGFASKLGMNYSKAQEKIRDRYEDLIAEGKKKKDAIEELKKELGIKD